jgi:hypothetical protein
MRARLLALGVGVVAGCIPDHAPKLGRPTQDMLAARADIYLPQAGEDLPDPGHTRDRTGTWSWPYEQRDRRRSVALVLSGGGVRGAFQAGALSRMFTNEAWLDERRVDHVFGVSVGALNGLLTGLAVSRTEAARGDPEPTCPDCYADETDAWDAAAERGRADPRYGLRTIDAWLLWRVWARMADYRWFQQKRTLIDFVIDGYLFDLRTLRLRLDQLVGDGDTLYLRAEPTTPGFEQACEQGGLHWPILHVGYVPYSTGVYRSVAYDPRREAEAACAALEAPDRPTPIRLGGGQPRAAGLEELDRRELRAEAIEDCTRAAEGGAIDAPTYPLSCSVLGWLESSCPTPEDGPTSCTREGSDICCTDDVDAFKDATWASTAQPLLHNPVPIDPGAEGYRLRFKDDSAGTDAAETRMREARRRAKTWNGSVNDRSGLGNHYPDLPRSEKWQSRNQARNARYRIYDKAPEDWRIDAGELEWAIDGGVREVFPLLEAMSTGVDEIVVVGNVPAQRPECAERFAEDLPGPAARTYGIMVRSILEEMISEIYNDDLLVARHLLQSAGRWNREKAWLVDLLRDRLDEAQRIAASAPMDPPGPAVSASSVWTTPAAPALAGPVIDHGRDTPLPLPDAELARQLDLLAGPCATQTVSDARLIELATEWLDCGGQDETICERAAQVARPPAVGFEGWRSYPAAMDRLRSVQADDLAACLAAQPADAAADIPRARPGYYRVPDVHVVLPDRFPGDPLDQVHQDMVLMMRDGYHRAGASFPLLDYSPPDACVSDTVCASCGGGRP